MTLQMAMIYVTILRAVHTDCGAEWCGHACICGVRTLRFCVALDTK